MWKYCILTYGGKRVKKIKRRQVMAREGDDVARGAFRLLMRLL